MNEERCKRLESRLAATDARLTALVEALEMHERDLASVLITPSNIERHRDLADRLAALRAPGEAPKSPHDAEVLYQKVWEALNGVPTNGKFHAYEVVADVVAALATARRERDEAVAILRDLDTWAATTKPEIPFIVARARALLAGQDSPGVAEWREALKAQAARNEAAALRSIHADCHAEKERSLAEIATLRASLAEAQGERDEAVGIVRDWLGWRAGSKGPGFGAIVDRARALVVREVAPKGGVDWEKTAQSRQDVIAVKDREIATLRASLAEAQGEVARLTEQLAEAKRDYSRRVAPLVYDAVVADRDDLAAEMERCHKAIDEALQIPNWDTTGSTATLEDRVDTLLSDRDALRARLDEAGRLIERAVELAAIVVEFMSGEQTCLSLQHSRKVLADLRAWKGE